MDTSTYVTAVGRRKTAAARVRLFEAKEATVVVNNQSVADYFRIPELVAIAKESLSAAELPAVYAATVRVVGGGKSAQAEAVRMAIARAATKINAGTRTTLKKAGFLSRDPRAKERKKPGLKKARKASQWSKR